MNIIGYEHIKVVQHNIGNGLTEPKLAMTDKNTPVVIKTYNGPEGNLVLFNELFCYRLAVLLDIKMPLSGICLIDNDTTIYNNCILPEQYGYGFFSTLLNKAVPLVDSIVPLMQNKSDFYRILLFDHIIFNSDRNPGNLLVQYYKKDITLQVIDHSHVFINQAIWNSNCLNRAISEKDYLSTRIVEDNSYLYEMFFRNLGVKQENFDRIIPVFKDKIKEETLRQILVDIPKEWMPPSKDIEALLSYIMYRTDHLTDICTTILHYSENRKEV